VEDKGNFPGRQTAFAALYGTLLGLALLKFGNPVILDRLIEEPTDIWQAVFSPWPVRWGQMLLVGIALLGLTVSRFHMPRPRWVVSLPLIWFAWQLFASAQTIDVRLTHVTLVHFATCLLCFGLGLFALRSPQAVVAVLAGVLPFFMWMAWTAFDQQFGGLEATERMIHETANWQQIYPPEYLERIEKKRVFATLVYPNALAGVVLLLLPVLLAATWQLTAKLTRASRILILGVVTYVAVACIFWSGSKSGWLVSMVLLLVALLQRPFSRRFKGVFIVAVCCAGLGSFAVKFAPYFRKGATSVSARLNYWKAAALTFQDHPLLGTGPGTFARAYAKIKPPGAEMAQLVHNDYLEQASDSGVLGFVSYAGFWWGSIVWLSRKARVKSAGLEFAVWLGLLGWCFQSFSEFGLYVPALAWPAFTMVGWLWAHEIE
jgi:hypothetical protein